MSIIRFFALQAFKRCLDNPYYLMNNFLTYTLAFICAAILFGWFTHRYIRGQLGLFLALKIAILITLIAYTQVDEHMLLIFTALWAISDGVLTPGFPGKNYITESCRSDTVCNVHSFAWLSYTTSLLSVNTLTFE